MLLVVPLGTLLAWWLATTRRGFFRTVVETLASLPLVLPPTVVGFGLLMLLGRGSAFGRWINDALGLQLLFTWPAATLASAVMALPLFVRPVTAAFLSADPDLSATARVEGATETGILRHVLVPLARRSLLAGFALAFARALGEFGATLMVAGSIPGETQTLALALYASVERGDNAEAWRTTAIILALALTLIVCVRALEDRGQ